MIISIFYLLLFLLSMVAEYILLTRIANRRASYYVALFTLVSVVCLGYFAYSISLDTGMALVANQFTYLDTTFVMMFFIFCILDICNIKVTRWIALPMSLAGLFFLLTAFTSGYHTWFYKKVEHELYKGSAHLHMEFGPLYTPLILYAVIMMLIPIGIMIYSIFHRRKISYKYTMALTLLLVAIVMMYFVEMVIGLGFDILPSGYVLMEYVILAIIHRIGLYDVSQMAVNVSESNNNYGCIIFDKKRCYVGANATAKYYFPELLNLDIDKEVTDPLLREEFVEWITLFDQGELISKSYERKERLLRCHMKDYVFGANKKSHGYVVEIWDDTDQQKFIRTLNQMNAELEETANEAKEANKAKSQFLANMSHEIRTPINAILGMNEIALRKCQDETLISYMEDIHTAGNNLLAIINDILDFSKIEAGKIDIIEDAYNLAELIREVTSLVGVKAEGKGLLLTVDVQKDLPSVLYGDSNRIRQIMVNLLNNAVKYTGEGTIVLQIRSLCTEAETIDLQIVVKDTGMGIKQEDLEHLFESFSRVDEKKNKNIEGTGLGLSITQRLVEMMGGSIQVESEYGVGTTFTVQLPQQIKDYAPLGDYSVKPKEAKKEEEHIDASSVRILIVDDNMMNLRVAKGLLEPTGARTIICSSGKACLTLLQHKSFDIVFMDHMMPEMDGIEALQKAKASDDIDTDNTAFIALTANAISGIREKYLEAGFDDYLSKPIDLQKMEEMIERFCLQNKK